MTYVSDTILLDVTEPEDEYTASQQRKLLARFKADGLLDYWPIRGQIEALTLSIYQPNKYLDADKFKVRLNNPAFDEEFEKYRLQYGDVIVRLSKDHTDLYVEIDDRKYLLHTFTPASNPDILFDYLLYKQPNQELTKKQLLDNEGLQATEQALNVITHKAGFKGRLVRYFLPVNEKNKVMLRPQLTLGVTEASKLEDDLSTLT